MGRRCLPFTFPSNVFNFARPAYCRRNESESLSALRDPGLFLFCALPLAAASWARKKRRLPDAEKVVSFFSCFLRNSPLASRLVPPESLANPHFSRFLPSHPALSRVSQLSCLFTVLLLSPPLVRDRLRNTRPMQWASRRGRSVLNVQMGAALLSALVLAVVNITVYVIPFLAQGPLQFAACGLDGIWEWGTPWFDWTYGTYLLVLAGLILALSLGAAGLTAFLSQYSGNYIAMLLKAVPLFVAVGVVLGSWLLDRPFTFRPLWDGYGPWVPKGAEAVAAAVLLALGLGLCALACRRQRKREL